MTKKLIHKNEYLFKINDPGDYFYIIFRGTLNVLVPN